MIQHYKKLVIVAVAMCFTLSGMAQECDKYLNPQDNKVNTKGVVLRVLGKAADVILGTNFSSLARPSGELAMLDAMQYEACMKLKKVKDSYNQDLWESRLEQALNDMVRQINQTGELPPKAVEQLVAQGILTPAQAQSKANGVIVPASDGQKTPATADDVPVPILPTPPAGNWVSITVPCQGKSSEGVIRGWGQETSMDMSTAKTVANVTALEELTSKIEVSVKSTTKYFIDQTKTNLNEQLETKLEKEIELTVDQTVRGYRTACEDFQQNDKTQQYRYFVALEINEDAVLKPIHDELQKKPELQKAVPNYKKFKDTFNQVLNYNEKAGDN